MPKLKDTSSQKISMFFCPQSNEERATKIHKKNHNEASASTSRSRVVDLEDVGVIASNSQNVDPLITHGVATQANASNIQDVAIQANASIIQDVAIQANASNTQVELHGIGATISFERDPGLRRQIYEYPKEQRNEVRREYLKMGPYHWSLKRLDYPLTKAKGDKENRRFNPKWYEMYPWLEYSPSKDSLLFTMFSF